MHTMSTAESRPVTPCNHESLVVIRGVPSGSGTGKEHFREPVDLFYRHLVFTDSQVDEENLLQVIMQLAEKHPHCVESPGVFV